MVNAVDAGVDNPDPIEGDLPLRSGVWADVVGQPGAVRTLSTGRNRAAR